MRIRFALLALPLLMFSAQAQTTNTEPAHKRQTMEQHFEQANVTHDGHLTRNRRRRATVDCPPFRRDRQGQEGYVTEADIRAYHKTQRTLHRQVVPTAPKAPNS